MSHNNHPIIHMIDGFVIAASGTNKEKTKKGIKLIIATLILYAGVWLGLRCVGYQPILSLVDIDTSIASAFSGFFIVIIGFIILAFFGLGSLIYLVTVLALSIGSLVGLIKKNDTEGNRLAAFLVNTIGFLVLVSIPFIFLI